MKKIKIKEKVLCDGTIIKTIFFKSHTLEQELVERYLDSIKANVICTTYMKNGKGCINYELKK